MSKEIRGSEKLKRECSGKLLSKEELEQVAGGASTSLMYGTFEPFPLGIPWPELFKAINSAVDPVQGDLRNIGLNGLKGGGY